MNRLQKKIISYEFAATPKEKEEDVCKELFDFIMKFRNLQFIQDEKKKSETRTAVCSAIRTFVALLDISKIEKSLEIYETGVVTQLDIWIELELTKMISRKMFAHRETTCKNGSCPFLIEQKMQKIVWTYARIVHLECFGNIVCDAIVALFSMRSHLAYDAAEEINGLPNSYEWFKEYCTDRVKDMQNGKIN